MLELWQALYLVIYYKIDFRLAVMSTIWKETHAYSLNGMHHFSLVVITHNYWISSDQIVTIINV